jgi:hypothetical protein
LRQAKLRILKKPDNAATKKTLRIRLVQLKKNLPMPRRKTLRISLVQLKKNLPIPRQNTLRIRLVQLKKSANPAAKNITHKRGLQLKNLPIPRQQHYECAWCSRKNLPNSSQAIHQKILRLADLKSARRKSPVIFHILMFDAQ